MVDLNVHCYHLLTEPHTERKSISANKLLGVMNYNQLLTEYCLTMSTYDEVNALKNSVVLTSMGSAIEVFVPFSNLLVLYLECF